MKSIVARNVNDAFAQGIPYLLKEGEVEQSRNGVVMVSPCPVTTTYENPCERVLFSPTRDANPFFHLMESLWMLAGRNDVSFPAFFNKRFAEYSDDGALVHGAYGYRWRVLLGMDQLRHIVDELKAKPTSRRAVLQMWSALGDLVPVQVHEYNSTVLMDVGGLGSKDVPCNTHAYFDVRHGKLNMTVCCRSNDVVWGAYGANAVHFSILLEYMAAYVGVEVGVYRQMSNNYHAYTDTYDLAKLDEIAKEAALTDCYKQGSVKPYPLVTIKDMDLWNTDLRNFMREPLKLHNYSDPFFKDVAAPMFRAYSTRKNNAGNGMIDVEKIAAEDWKLACTQWVSRREKGN